MSERERSTEPRARGPPGTIALGFAGRAGHEYACRRARASMRFLFMETRQWTGHRNS